MADLTPAIQRTLSFLEVLGYAPTRTELFCLLDVHEKTSVDVVDFQASLTELLEKKILTEYLGRVGFTEKIQEITQEIQAREIFQPRKRRRAVWVAKYLARLSSVRFVALANTTAFGYARDFGDLDFFIIVKGGSIWRTRLFAVLPFKILGLLPDGDRVRDAVCLSYFISDDALDLSRHQLAGDDPYFRYWFLSPVPLYDDGVSKELWEKNASLRAQHPVARVWIAPPDLAASRPRLRLPLFGFFEGIAKWIQLRWFPASIRAFMNVDSRVMVTDQVLKFHVEDGREEYRKKYYEICRERNIKNSLE